MTAIPSSAPAVGGLPPIDPALIPQSVRNGDRAAKNAYQTGLAFEDMLVSELVHELTATVPGLDGTGSQDGSDAGAAGAGGPSGSGADGSALGGGSALGAYSPLLGQALTSGIMGGGGTGVAMQIARSLDPALDNPPGPSTAPGSTR